MKKMNKKLNKLIEMLKEDKYYYSQCMYRQLSQCMYRQLLLRTAEYDSSSDALITRYSNILTYIDSLLERIDVELEQAEVKSNIEYSNGLTDSREDDYNNTIIVC